jgi:hypothetical protein
MDGSDGPPSELSFGELLDWLMTRGIRPRGALQQGVRWTKSSFAGQVGRSPRQVSNWLKNESLPLFDDPVLATIERIFFGLDQNHQASRRLEIREALKRSRTKDTPQSAASNDTTRSSAEMRAFVQDNAEPTIGVQKEFLRKLNLLPIDGAIRQSAIFVANHREYPIFMAVSDAVQPNPVWKSIQKATILQLSNDYNPRGPVAPRVMHLDMLLLRRNDKTGHAELYTYYSDDWETFLLHFRQRMPEDRPSDRNKLNEEKIARHWGIPVGAIEARALEGKYLVSVKRDPKHGDLVFYIFEFCVVILKHTYDKPLDLDARAPKRRWLSLEAMRRDEGSWSVNGDIIRALHLLFAYDLEPLPLFVS